MTALRRGQRFGGSHPRRVTQWIGPALSGYTTIATTGATLIASASFGTAQTVVRNRGFVSILSADHGSLINVRSGALIWKAPTCDSAIRTSDSLSVTFLMAFESTSKFH